MAHYASLSFQPQGEGTATTWAHDWRRRWFRHVGCCVDYRGQGILYLAYSDDRPPEMRLALQAELEAAPNGIADVIAVCAAKRDEFNRMVLEQGRAG